MNSLPPRLRHLGGIVLLLVWWQPLAVAGDEYPRRAPAFTHTEDADWINSPPLTMADLHGEVVLLDLWTFDCWNCYRSFPWLKGLERRYSGRPFRVISVHAPEFAHERERANVVGKIREFGLEHPVMLDNDFSFWRALGNRYWPTFYVIDTRGRVRGRFIGEMHAGERRAREVEAMIEKLLGGSAP